MHDYTILRIAKIVSHVPLIIPPSALAVLLDMRKVLNSLIVVAL